LFNSPIRQTVKEQTVTSMSAELLVIVHIGSFEIEFVAMKPFGLCLLPSNAFSRFHSPGPDLLFYFGWLSRYHQICSTTLTS
jgi:hypothetical protein